MPSKTDTPETRCETCYRPAPTHTLVAGQCLACAEQRAAFKSRVRAAMGLRA